MFLEFVIMPDTLLRRGRPCKDRSYEIVLSCLIYRFDLYDRDAEQLAEDFGVDDDPLCICIPVHIQHKDERHAEFDQLKGDIQIPLQMCGIHDIDDDIRLFI